MNSVMSGNISAVEKLIDDGETPLARNFKGETILFVAIQNGDTKMVYALINKINIENFNIDEQFC